MPDSTMDISGSKVKPLRCAHPECKKKLGLLGFECRCKKQFCGQHRDAEVHSCEHDYKSDAKKELLKFMSTPVLAPKIAVI